MISSISGDRLADLHTHSLASDGQFSVGLLLKEAEKKGIRYISITDHENVSQTRELIEILSLYNLEIKAIPGVEISTKFYNQEIHVLAYYNPDLTEKVEDLVLPLKEEKKKRVIKTLELLRGVGINIPKCFLADNEKTFNRMIVARFMYHNFSFGSIEEVFKKYFDSDPRFKVEGNYPRTDEIARELSSLGCFVGIAHPDFLEDEKNVDCLEKLVEEGVKGIEVFHPLLDNGLSELLIEFCKKKGLVCLGGSDFHGYDSKRRELGEYNTFSSSAKEILKFLDL